MSSLAFIVPCTNCLKMYDAMNAQWCDCIGDDQTLRCPHCGRCFCRAATQYKTEFLRMAPKALYEQRRTRSAGPAGRFAKIVDDPPADIVRPMVLVVDDSRIVRLTTMRIVHGLGYGAIEAADADQAEALTLLYQPEVVLTDALMPKIDGRELCRMIKSSPFTRNTKVILMTGLYKAPHYKYEAFHSFGVDEYLLKPIEAEELRKLLERLVGLPAAAMNFDIVA
jgi:CheY-like chemotaxis protein